MRGTSFPRCCPVQVMRTFLPSRKCKESINYWNNNGALPTPSASVFHDLMTGLIYECKMHWNLSIFHRWAICQRLSTNCVTYLKGWLSLPNMYTQGRTESDFEYVQFVKKIVALYTLFMNSLASEIILKSNKKGGKIQKTRKTWPIFALKKVLNAVMNSGINSNYHVLGSVCTTTLQKQTFLVHLSKQ